MDTSSPLIDSLNSKDTRIFLCDKNRLCMLCNRMRKEINRAHCIAFKAEEDYVKAFCLHTEKRLRDNHVQLNLYRVTIAGGCTPLINLASITDWSEEASPSEANCWHIRNKVPKVIKQVHELTYNSENRQKKRDRSLCWCRTCREYCKFF